MRSSRAALVTAAVALLVARGASADGPSAPGDPSPTMGEKRSSNVVAFHGGFGSFDLLGGCVTLGAGVHLDPDTLVELGGVAGVVPWATTTTSASVSFGVRRFATESFYVRGGLRFRHVVQEAYVDDVAVPEADRPLHRVVVDDVAVDLAIGNRWQWGAFTFGVDWLGFAFPVAIVAAREEETGSRSGRVIWSRKLDASNASAPPDVRVNLVQLGAAF